MAAMEEDTKTAGADHILRRIERRLRVLQETSPVVIYACRPDGDFNAIFVGDNITEILGYDAREFIDTPKFWVSHIHPDDAHRVLTTITNIIENPHLTLEYRFLHSDGTYRWMHDEFRLLRDDNGIPLEILGSWMDFTERKEIEESLRQSEERFRIIAENMLDLVSIMDKEGNYIYVSPSHTFITGFEPEELMKRPAVDMIHPDDLSKVLSVLTDIITHCSSGRVEYRALHKELGYRWFESVGNVVCNPAGDVAQIIVNTRDITDRKKTEEEIKHLFDELKRNNVELEAQKILAEGARLLAEASNRTKTEFLANMSHELTTPLNAILGFSEVLKDGLCGELNTKQYEYVEQIESSGRYLFEMLINIVDLAHVEFPPLNMHMSISRLLIKDIIYASISMFHDRSIKQNIKLNFSVDSGADITIEANAAQVKQILFLLVDNALKFTPNGGSVSVSASRRKDAIEISVSDNGTGIEPERVGELFQLLTQLEQPYEKKHPGAGVGLYLAKRLVQLHGGRIWAESTPGKGSVFTFTLPIKQEKSNGT